MSNIPLDFERRSEKRAVARFLAERKIRQQHRLEQQLTAPDKSKGETCRGYLRQMRGRRNAVAAL